MPNFKNNKFDILRDKNNKIIIGGWQHSDPNTIDNDILRKFMNDKRVELKYLVNIFDTNKIIRNLKSLPLNFKEKYKTRLVNNIYFDTQQNHSLQEHLNGIKNRYKIRIRWYGDFENFLKPVLEFKIKKNKITIKKKLI